MRRLNLQSKKHVLQPLKIQLLLHTEILKVYCNSTYIKYTQNNPDNRIKNKHLYILNESSDQTNLKKQSGKYIYNYQCLPTVKNSNAKH